MTARAGARCALAAAWLALAAAPVPGRAGPPYFTDDPEPVELRHWEIYLATQWSRDRDGGLSGTAPHVEVNYGALPEVQLHVVAPLALARPASGPTAWGLGDLELGAKVRFLEESPVRPQIGVFPLVELPTGDADRGLGAGEVQAFLPLWIQKRFGPWTTYGGGGWWLNPGAGNRNYVALGWLLQREVAPGVTPGVEVFHTAARTVGGTSETRVAAGLVLDLSEVHHLLVSAGRTFGGGDALQAYLAWQLTLGPRDRE
ncbi:transporter [Anaeromyxobacter oryzisoli]|uniref:transporter n=1 Tax=Anaeromyxobacter oryzisoli TaxID=2925408 RepID=UPI001F56FA67|nr:transporter [Anaeromyxobacter sp. SG63]